MLLDVKLEAESSVVPEAQTDPAPPGPASDAGAPASCAAPVPLNASQCDACFQKSIDQRKLLTHDVNHFKKRLQSLEPFRAFLMFPFPRIPAARQRGVELHFCPTKGQTQGTLASHLNSELHGKFGPGSALKRSKRSSNRSPNGEEPRRTINSLQLTCSFPESETSSRRRLQTFASPLVSKWPSGRFWSKRSSGPHHGSCRGLLMQGIPHTQTCTRGASVRAGFVRFCFCFFGSAYYVYLYFSACSSSCNYCVWTLVSHLLEITGASPTLLLLTGRGDKRLRLQPSPPSCRNLPACLRAAAPRMRSSVWRNKPSSLFMYRLTFIAEGQRLLDKHTKTKRHTKRQKIMSTCMQNTQTHTFHKLQIFFHFLVCFGL